MAKEAIFIYGAGGHAKVVADIVERQGLCDVAFIVDDDPALEDEEIYGYRIIGGRTKLVAARDEQGIRRGIVAIGGNSVRLRVAASMAAEGLDFVTAVHPSAQWARGVEVGVGAVVMGGVVVNSDARIGDHAIINTGATVDHDCQVGNGVHVGPGATLCGTVTVGECAFVGAGSTVIQGLTIGENAMVAAGATVVHDVPDGLTVYGTPAKPRRD
jgi:sugar O-acyltransferase (sialic acid O-acetyltransferase NeuD family)